MFAIEVLISSASPAVRDEIHNRLVALLQGNGFAVDQSTYEPSEAVQSELAALAEPIEQGADLISPLARSRATIKLYEA